MKTAMMVLSFAVLLVFTYVEAEHLSKLFCSRTFRKLKMAVHVITSRQERITQYSEANTKGSLKEFYQ